MAEKYERPDEWEKKFKEWMAEKHKKNPSDYTEQIKQQVIDTKPFAPVHEKEETAPLVAKSLIFLAFAIPIAILLYGLYINYLPFGWEKGYKLTINEEGIISPVSSEIYITNTQGRKLLSIPNGVEGQANIVIEPKVVLKNATIEIEINGENVFLGTPIKLDISKIKWDSSWDFTHRIPLGLNGTAQYNEEKCVYFDAVQEQTLSLPSSADKFESGPFSVYIKWKPSSTSQMLGDYQQLVGHYNWEIYQGTKTVRFQIGRMNDSEGPFYSVSYPITPDFFDKEHELLAVYSPDENGSGYIELRVDGQFAQRVLIGADTIYKDYNSDRNLNFGWSSHNYGKYPYYSGCIYETKIVGVPIWESQTSGTLHAENSKTTIPVIGNGKLISVDVNVKQEGNRHDHQ